MSIGNWAENKILDKVYRATDFTITTPYVSLHTADPGETGANEVTGGSYARQSGSFAVAAGGSTSNSAQISFTNMPASTITHVGIWDASSGGNFVWGGPISIPVVLNLNDTYNIPTGDLQVSLN